MTPFKINFVDYVEYDIPVNDITEINRVIGIDTATNNLIDTNGVVFYFSCVLYHTQKTYVFLFSLQTYHQIHRGHSVVYDFQVEMVFPYHNILIHIEKQKGNLPVVHNSQFTQK